MKRKITTILLAMLLVIGTAIGLCACANQEDIDNALLPVEQQVTLINTTLDDMKATDKTLGDSITALTGRVTTLEGELEEVNAKITSLQADSATKAELETVKTALQKQIDDLNDEIDELKAKDTELQNQIADLRDSLTGEIKNVKDWANSMFISIENWNTAKAQIESDITALYNTVGAIEDTLEMMNTTITALQEQIDQNKQDIKDLQDLVDHLKNCINGKHETDTDTYTWADDFSSCTASGNCKYCGAELNETTTNITDDGFNRTATFENPLFKAQTIDLTDLTWMSSSMYENALNIVFSKGETDVTLNLPKDFNVNFIESAISDKSSVNVNLTLKGVEKINDKAFQNSQKLQSIILPDVIEIGEYAFELCSNLVSVSAEKVQKIGKSAFNFCNNITELSFPEATEIGEHAFNKCTKLSKISLPKLTKVSSTVFDYCENLKEIELPKVIELDSDAFFYSYLEAITFGSQITVMGKDALRGFDCGNCVITLAKGQKDFKVNDEETKYVISENEVEAGENKTFCGKTFKEIIIAEE